MENLKKHTWIGLSLILLGVIVYNIYGKEITTSGLKRADGTYFTNRVIGVFMVLLGIIVAFGSKIQNMVVNKIA